MKIKHTVDSPILLKFIPETPTEAFENGRRKASMEQMGIPHRTEEGGILIFNIDPGWRTRQTARNWK